MEIKNAYNITIISCEPGNAAGLSIRNPMQTNTNADIFNFVTFARAAVENGLYNTPPSPALEAWIPLLPAKDHFGLPTGSTAFSAANEHPGLYNFSF